MYPDPRRLENIMSIRDAMRQISQEADAIVELLDARIEAKHLDGSTEAEDVREVLEVNVSKVVGSAFPLLRARPS
jgi:hypothetical protein